GDTPGAGNAVPAVGPPSAPAPGVPVCGTDQPCVARYSSTIAWGMRPRSLTCLPAALAHARISALRSLPDAPRCFPREVLRLVGALRAASTNGASAERSFAALSLLRSIS